MATTKKKASVKKPRSSKGRQPVKDRIPPFYKYVKCRTSGHHWNLREDSPKRSGEGGWWFVSDCENCPCIQKIYTDHRGKPRPDRSHIVYPADGSYQLEKGLYRPHFRVHMMHQAMNK